MGIIYWDYYSIRVILGLYWGYIKILLRVRRRLCQGYSEVRLRLCWGYVKVILG